MKKWLTAMILAQALDASTTCVGLSRGYQELNPLLHNKSCSEIVLTKAGITAGVGLPLWWMQKKYPKSKAPKWAALVMTVAASAAGGWNLYQLSK